MKIISLLLIISISLIITRDPPVITLYAESLCPYCLGFASAQLPLLQRHPNKALLFKTIDTVWYGNSKELPDSAPFNRKFICQHGANECNGNIVMICAENNLVVFDDLYSFTSCIAIYALNNYNNMNFDTAVQSCTNGLSASLILTCAKSGVGAELHHAAAAQTGPHQYVPFFLVDGVHTEEINDEITTDLVKFLCAYNDLTGKVAGC